MHTKPAQQGMLRLQFWPWWTQRPASGAPQVPPLQEPEQHCVPASHEPPFPWQVRASVGPESVGEPSFPPPLASGPPETASFRWPTKPWLKCVTEADITLPFVVDVRSS